MKYIKLIELGASHIGVGAMGVGMLAAYTDAGGGDAEPIRAIHRATLDLGVTLMRMLDR